MDIYIYIYIYIGGDSISKNSHMIMIGWMQGMATLVQRHMVNNIFLNLLIGSRM
jgi:hypothetical protein